MTTWRSTWCHSYPEGIFYFATLPKGCQYLFLMRCNHVGSLCFFYSSVLKFKARRKTLWPCVSCFRSSPSKRIWPTPLFTRSHTSHSVLYPVCVSVFLISPLDSGQNPRRNIWRQQRGGLGGGQWGSRGFTPQSKGEVNHPPYARATALHNLSFKNPHFSRRRLWTGRRTISGLTSQVFMLFCLLHHYLSRTMQ